MADDLKFDDRVDTQYELTIWQILGLMGRSLVFLRDVKGLFLCKCVFALVSVVPALATPWILKIVVDQVILGQPFDATDVPTPLFLQPFVNSIQDLTPNGMMLAVTALFGVLLVTFGFRLPPAETSSREGMPGGFDSATASEQSISAGGSSANGVWGLVESLVTIRMTQRLANGLRTLLMGRLAKLNMTTLDDQRIGDSVYRVMYDAPMMPEICYNLTITPVLMVISTVLSVYLLQYSYGVVAPELVWIALAVVPLTLVLTAPMSAFTRRVHQLSRASGSATTNSMEEGIDNIAAVQSLGGMQKEVKRFEANSSESYRRFRHTIFVEGLIKIATYCAVISAMSVTFVLITDDVITGALSPGDYAVLIGMLLMLTDTSMTMGSYWINLQKNVAAVRRVFFFIDHTVEGDRDIQSLDPIKKGVILDNVCFAYPDGRQVLSHVDLELPIGELVAIVGPTGAGKTTLAYLLPGYLRPSEGQVRFDGRDIAQVDPIAIRHQVTYVFQEHMLLSDSIRENLRLGNPLASEDDMWQACRIAGAEEFIQRFPEGLDTMIGKSGDTLSVGQKQRLSIARGLVRNTPVIVLDEPTAALDPQTENALVASLRQAAKGRLVIVIAHRLSTIRKADRIVFLEEGRVVDIGSHSALMADDHGRYRRFVDLQSV
jgi:ABC-type multidrug transport system fused ATPase/permease subunit